MKTDFEKLVIQILSKHSGQRPSFHETAASEINILHELDIMEMELTHKIEIDSLKEEIIVQNSLKFNTSN